MDNLCSSILWCLHFFPVLACRNDWDSPPTQPPEVILAKHYMAFSVVDSACSGGFYFSRLLMPAVAAASILWTHFNTEHIQIYRLIHLELLDPLLLALSFPPVLEYHTKPLIRNYLSVKWTASILLLLICTCSRTTSWSPRLTCP